MPMAINSDAADRKPVAIANIPQNSDSCIKTKGEIKSIAGTGNQAKDNTLRYRCIFGVESNDR